MKEDRLTQLEDPSFIFDVRYLLPFGEGAAPRSMCVPMDKGPQIPGNSGEVGSLKVVVVISEAPDLLYPRPYEAVQCVSEFPGPLSNDIEDAIL